MRKSFAILVIVLLALLAAALAPIFKSDPGLVQVRMFGWTIETSVLVLIIAILVVWLVAAFLYKLWKLPADAARRMGEQRALAHLEKGLLALTEGDWRTAERALEKSTNAQGKTTARYLAAAQAADGQDETDRAEWYLEQADGGGRKQRFIVALTRARILCGNRRFDEARPILEDLQSRRRRHPQVLELLTECYRELGDWDGMQRILPALRKAGIVDDERAQELSLQAAVAKLRQSPELDHLTAAYQGLNKPTQRLAEVARAYAERAIELGDPARTESVLRSILKSEWHSALLIPYGVPGPDDAKVRIKQCEKWLNTHAEDSMLHLALGRLCVGEQLWGKAREYMIRSLELEPSMIGYESLGQLLERMGELETAMACFRNALRMSQGKKPEPLPGDPARLTSPV